MKTIRSKQLLRYARQRAGRAYGRIAIGLAALTLSGLAATAQANHINYGSWNSSLITTDALSIHAALMPTASWLTSSSSRVFFFGGSQHDPELPFGKNSWRLYDPATGSVTALNFNVQDTFCSGHAHTKDGNLVIVGGNEYYAGITPARAGHIPNGLAPTAPCGASGTINIHKCAGHFTGTKKTYAFNSAFNTLTALPDMAHGRWYPSIVRVTGGGYQLAAMAGHISASEQIDPVSGHDNWDLDTFTDGTAGWATVGELGTPNYYPRAHLVPYAGGSLVVNSVFDGDTAVVQFSSGSAVGVPIATPPAEYRGFDTSSVLLPLRPNASGVYPAGRILVTNAAQNKMLDLANTAAGWQTVARPNPAAGGTPRVRMHAIATLLATGDVFVSGGYSNPTDENTAVKYTEIFREDLGVTHEGPSAVVGRNYHSTALLLPDGRVWTAGGNKRAGFAQTGQPNGDGRELRVEIFTPWYYNLSRPTFASGLNLWQPPSSGTWRINTGLGTTGTSITRVALIAPGSVTHAFNNDQRYVELRVTNRSAGWVEVNVPADESVLPRGFYMLVISRSSNGNAAGAHIPSVARWVSVP